MAVFRLSKGDQVASFAMGYDTGYQWSQPAPFLGVVVPARVACL
jgi:hypothetical protein